MAGNGGREITAIEPNMEARLAGIRECLDHCEAYGLPVIASRSTIRLLFQAIEDMKKQNEALQKHNTLLESRIFGGIDPRGKTDIRKLYADLDEAMRRDCSGYMDNDRLLAHMGRHQV